MTDEDIDAINEEIKAKGLEKSWQNHWPTLTRDTGATILSLIQESEPGINLRNEYNFAADSLFCEWAYVLDLDGNNLEVYRGFNKEPLTEADRFFDLEKASRKNNADKEYYPVKLVKIYSLEGLPTVGEMVADCRSPEEQEDED